MYATDTHLYGRKTCCCCRFCFCCRFAHISICIYIYMKGFCVVNAVLLWCFLNLMNTKKENMKTFILYCNRSSAWVYYICSRKGATSEQGATFINVIILMIFVRMCCAGVGVARIVKKKPETSRRIMNQIARISLLWRGVLYHNGYFFLFSASIEPVSHKERIYQIGYCKADRTMHNAYNTFTNF